MIYKFDMAKAVVFGVSLTSLVLAGCGSSMDRVQGSQKPITDERPIEAAFTKIDVEVPCKFQVHQGDKQSVKIFTDDNLLEHLHTDVVGDSLKVTRCANWTNASVCQIEVTCPSVNSISIKGAANGVVDKVADKTFDVSISGAGDVRANGACDKVNISISGAGNVDLGEVKCKTASVSMSGAGSAVVYPSDDLNATISGAGSVKYKGKPELHQKVSGVGKVVAI